MCVCVRERERESFIISDNLTGLVWFVFYGISTILCNLTPDPFLCIYVR